MASYTGHFLKADVSVPDSHIVAPSTHPTATTTTLPIYTGFMTPSDILRFAEVPNFGYHPSTQNSGGKQPGTTTHDNIATKLKTSPTNEWQRPLNTDRMSNIASVFSNWQKMSLMANPVLLGESSHTSGTLATISTPNPTLVNGHVAPELFDITFEANGAKPLWILDGQHRIHGLANSSTQFDQKIPVVFLIKHPKFTMEFLAQVFTEVTTGAQDLEELHKHWMLFSFGMDPFVSTPPNNRHKAMLAVLELCTTGSIGGLTNPFFDQVKFNPYDPSSVGPDNITYTVKEWTALLDDCYYSQGGTLSAANLAKQIVLFLRAAKGLDASGTASKIFGTDPHTIIRDALMKEFLKHAAAVGISATTSQSDWEAKLNTGNWSASAWNLPWLAAGVKSGTSGAWSTPSQRAINHTMNKLFEDPAAFGGNAPSVYLQSQQDITLVAKKKTPSGNWSSVDQAEIQSNGSSYSINSGVAPWGACAPPRSGVQFTTPATGLMSITDAKWSDSSSPVKSDSLNITGKKTTTAMVDLSPLTSPVTIEVEVCCYSSTTKKTYQYVISW